MRRGIPAAMLVTIAALTLSVAAAQQPTAQATKLSASEVERFLREGKIGARRAISVGVNGTEWAPMDDGKIQHRGHKYGRFEIYVSPFPNVNAGEWRVSMDGGTRPLWSPTGEELFYVAPNGALMAVRVNVAAGTWNPAGAPMKIIEGTYVTGGQASPRTYDISPDGKKFLLIKSVAAPSMPSQIIVVQNWTEELQRLTAAGGK